MFQWPSFPIKPTLFKQWEERSPRPRRRAGPASPAHSTPSGSSLLRPRRRALQRTGLASGKPTPNPTASTSYDAAISGYSRFASQSGWATAGHQGQACTQSGTRLRATLPGPYRCASTQLLHTAAARLRLPHPGRTRSDLASDCRPSSVLLGPLTTGGSLLLARPPLEETYTKRFPIGSRRPT